MAALRNSNKNQRPVEATYRFGEFELHPGERLLTKNREPAPLTPKAFDALLYLVSNAGHLVRKSELMDTLWPSTFVEEANLTNTVMSLRKILGHDAIRTVSKHGYRFELPVEGEPGVPREVYERFSRAKVLMARRSLDSMKQARELYWICLAEDPAFAPAWAWLGRCCACLAKFSNEGPGGFELPDAAFKRALALDPDLACAHQFYTPVEADMGHARCALTRLRDRLRRHPDEPESHAGLVQVFRYCGLLEHSIEAHNRARDLDPAIGTSVPFAYFLAGNYEATVEMYSGGAGGYYLDAAAWTAMGHGDRAAKLLRGRLESASLSELMRCGMESLLAIIERRFDNAFRRMEESKIVRDAEMLLFLARHYSYIGAAEQAIAKVRNAADSGFVCAPYTLQCDPWLAAVRTNPEFPSLLSEAKKLVGQALESLVDN
jgi:DNA-binding winged helix-turn-helix (wHTH) protein